MQKSKLLVAVLIAAALIVYFYSAVHIKDTEIHNIGIDASTPLHIVWPFEVSVVGDMGERGLRIGPNIGRGWKDEAGGDATYRFHVPRDGQYHVWAYCLWHDACSNAIFARFDDLEKAIIGNDPTYNEWHWVRGFSIHLERGTHTLKLSNHSDNVAVQKLFLTNSDLMKPDTADKVFADIFYDGFDGCDQGNFASWETVSGEWKVYNPFDAKNTADNVLVGRSEKTAMIVIRNDQWSDYSINISVQLVALEGPDSSVGICFGLKSQTEYYQLELQQIDNPAKVTMKVIKKSADTTDLLASAEMPWQRDTLREVDICVTANNLVITVDDKEVAQVPVEDEITGGIGLRLEGKATAYFDNVHIRQANR